MSDKSSLSPSWREAIIFGVLWGGIEVTLGSFLHAMKLPFSGFFLSIVGAALLIAGRSVFPRRGFCLRAGVICAGIKCFGPTGMILGPLVAILMESLIVELCFFVPAKKFAAVLAGILVAAWSLSQGVISQVIFYGENIISLYMKIFEKAQATFGLDGSMGTGVLFAVLALLFLPAALGGYLGDRIGQKASYRYWQEEP